MPDFPTWQRDLGITQPILDTVSLPATGDMVLVSNNGDQHYGLLIGPYILCDDMCLSAEQVVIKAIIKNDPG